MLTNMLRAAVALSFLLATPAVALDVVQCGQVVPQRQVGVLTTDLSCFGSIGVTLESLATLDMNGHQISGGTTGVLCMQRRCRIDGPGRITGASSCAVQPQNGSGPIKITVSGVDIDTNYCALAGSRAKDISLRLEDVSVTNNPSSLSAGRINATNVTVTGNGIGMDGRRNVRLIDSTVEGNDGIGVIARKGLTARNSSVTGNDSANGFDLASHLPPRVYATTCGRSVVIPEPFALPGPGDPSWGVCSGD